MTTTPKSTTERAGSVLNVPGRFFSAHAWDADRFSNQTWISERREIKGYKAGQMQVTIQFDDQCRNGHNTFTITAEVTELRNGLRQWAAGGCLHHEISQAFPELAPLIKWHLTSSDGPMHYPGNAVYHAGNRDCNGLLKGERRQIRNGRTGQLAWELAFIDAAGNKVAKPAQYLDSDTQPECAAGVAYVPWEREGEGKSRELGHARSAAVWPEATDEQLTVEPDELRAVLVARLPALLVAFREAVTGAGLAWTPAIESTQAA